LNWIYPGLVESHAQSAYDHSEHNRKVGLREHVVSIGLPDQAEREAVAGFMPAL
jgi:hypothetical protein